MDQDANIQILDRQFVYAATVVGLVYSLIVVALGAAVGKEAAGVAGVALTALATGIFKQFETLRFRAIADSEARSIRVPKLSLARIAILGFAIFGVQVSFGMVAGAVVAVLDVVEEATGMEEFIELLTNWKILLPLIGMTAVSYLLVGYLSPKAFHLSMYSEVTIAAFLCAAGQSLLPLIPILIEDASLFWKILRSMPLWPAAFWLLYVALALVGARVGTIKRKNG